MAWLRIDDRVRTHPKIAMAGPAAAWLWFCGVCYCREHLTDGFIPKAAVVSLAMNLTNPWRHASRLVEVRLWEEAHGGFQVHDFLDWNPSKSDVIASRQSEAARKRSERGVSVRINTGVHSESSHARAGDAGYGSVAPIEELDLREESARETDPPVWRRRQPDTSLMAGEGSCRKNCAPWAVGACQRGVCIPKYLWPKWERRKDRSELRTFVDRWAERCSAAGDKPESFWPAAFESEFGTSAPATKRGDKTTRALDAVEEAIRLSQLDQKAVGDGRG